jgi:ADP-ribose pyrophosphatase
MNDTHLIESPLASELIYDSKIVHLSKETVTLPNGQPAIREVIRHVGAVCVVPLTN